MAWFVVLDLWPGQTHKFIFLLSEKISEASAQNIIFTYFLPVKSCEMERLNVVHPYTCICLFVHFIALRPKSTAMVMAGRYILIY